jgi:hypothetical protein
MEGHEELRPYLFAIAYRMLGSVAEARRRSGSVPALPRDRRRGGVAQGVPGDSDGAARDRPVALGACPSRGLSRRVAARAARRRRSSPARRDGRLPLAHLSAPAREAIAGRARRVLAPGGVRLPLPRDQPNRRQEPRQLPPDPHPRAQAHRGGKAPLRRFARGARGGCAQFNRRLGGGRHRRARRVPSSGRPRLRRRRRQGAGRSRAARRRRARGKGAHRLGPGKLTSGASLIAEPASTASRDWSFTTSTVTRSGSRPSKSPRVWSLR